MALGKSATHLLDNLAWHSLTGAHARFSVRNDEARRYAPGFSPILGFADMGRPNFEALDDLCASGENFYCAGLHTPVPRGWQINAESEARQLLWSGEIPEEDNSLPTTRLGPSHVPHVMELFGITKPGPFAPRTIELGEFFGVFEGGRLAAMAGERMTAGTWREISGVCTHPDFQGRGLAQRLTKKLINIALQRGERPFLHVMLDNAGARRLYEKMGFVHHQIVTFQIVFKT
jgi:ribosomal protein S18 acetylase RimI-like enzyme